MTQSEDPPESNRGERHLLDVGDEHLSFHRVELPDPVPTARQILSASGHRPVTAFMVLGMLPEGGTEHLRLGATWDLRERGIEKVLVFKTDELLPILVDDTDMLWGAPTVTGRVLMTVAGLDPEENEIFLEVVGGVDEPVPLDGPFDLTRKGIERFVSRPKARETTVTLKVVVNGKETEVTVEGNDALVTVRDKALQQSDNVGRPAEDWELKTEEGEVLDLATLVRDTGFKSGTVLFLSLKAGVAGEMQSVDEAVSRTKFEREVAQFREHEDAHRRRGCFLLDATFPQVFVAFAAPRLKPSALVGAVVIDFTNYDLQPPSVTFVDPFTREPLRAADMTMNMFRRPPMPGVPPEMFEQLLASGQIQPAAMIASHGPNECPFLCLPGVREYHEHPAHTGDSWLLHRGSGSGSLHFLVEQILTYGVSPIDQYRVELRPTVAGFGIQAALLPQ